MIKVFNIVYDLNGKEKHISFNDIPEKISEDEFALSTYLRTEIAKQEDVQEHDISIVEASCFFKFG